MGLTREDVLSWLRQFKDPSSGDIIEAGVVRAHNVEDNDVCFVM